VEIAQCGARRGPAPEAQALYIDHTPVVEPKPKNPEESRVGGRPTKKDRRSLMLSRKGSLE
jgi:ribosome-associated heat shock protein Hsp15